MLQTLAKRAHKCVKVDCTDEQKAQAGENRPQRKVLFHQDALHAKEQGAAQELEPIAPDTKHGSCMDRPHDENQDIAQQCGDGRTHGPPKLNQEKISHQVAYGANHCCGQGSGTVLFDHID